MIESTKDKNDLKEIFFIKFKNRYGTWSYSQPFDNEDNALEISKGYLREKYLVSFKVNRSEKLRSLKK